jgi:hypothetical protein
MPVTSPRTLHCIASHILPFIFWQLVSLNPDFVVYTGVQASVNVNTVYVCDPECKGQLLCKLMYTDVVPVF